MDYKIQYKKGCENVAADALSRRDSSSEGKEDQSGDNKVDQSGDISELNTISELQPVWLQQVVNSYEGDEEYQNVISQMLLEAESNINFEFQFVQGILKKKEKKFWEVMEILENKLSMLCIIQL